MDRLNRRLETQVKKIREGSFSTRKNCQTLLRFLSFCDARNISTARRVIVFDKLALACKHIPGKDFQAWNRRDVEGLFSQLAKEKRGDGRKRYSEWSVSTVASVLKAFFRWLNNGKLPAHLEWVKGTIPPSKLVKQDLLEPKEIEAMLKGTRNVMHQALISCFTSSARPAEIHSIRLGDITDLGDFIRISVGATEGKMAKRFPPRQVYILGRFIDYFRPWIQHHPQKGKKDAWLWVNREGQKIDYDDMRKILGRVAKQAGIEKRVFPYLFRHSVLTFLYKNQNPEIARRIAGHSAASRMTAVYVHLDSSDIEESLRGKVQKQAVDGFSFDARTETDNVEMQIILKILSKLAQKDPELLREVAGEKEIQDLLQKWKQG